MAFQKTKIDPDLGWKVHEHLVKLGLETPMVLSKVQSENKEKIEKIEGLTREIWETLGYDLNDDSLTETPKRIAKMLVLETMWGLDPAKFPKLTVVENKFNYDEVLTVSNIEVSSTCEHHGVVIDGYAQLAYKPSGKVIGISKLNRVVEYFCKRGQVQERLTVQISETLKYLLGTEDVALAIDAVHYCVKSRGVEDHASYTTTTSLSGIFKNDPASRSEFMTYLQNAQQKR